MLYLIDLSTTAGEGQWKKNRKKKRTRNYYSTSVAQSGTSISRHQSANYGYKSAFFSQILWQGWYTEGYLFKYM